MDLQKMCRLCAFKVHKSKGIFTTPDLLQKITRLTDIKIREGDGLPCSICDICDIKLQITDEYRHQVEKADYVIRALALKQTAELNRQGGICRERMHLQSEWKSLQNKFSKSGINLGNKIAEKSLIYSYETTKSLVTSYEALITRCRAQGLFEDFALPSSIVTSDSENEEMDERAARFAAARRRLGIDKRKTRKINGPDINHDFPEQDHQDLISLRIPVDPLNLLTVKRVRPLLEDDSDSDVPAESSFRPFPSRVESWRRGTSGFEDLDVLPSTECSESNNNSSCDEFRPSDFGSCSSVSSLKTIDPPEEPRSDYIPPSSIEQSKNLTISNDQKVAGNLRSGAQCPICDRILANTRGLKIHFWIHKAVRCQICDVSTDTKEKFRDHMQLHIRPIETADARYFQCLVCKNLFKTNIGLNMHMRIHSKSVPAVKNCPYCKKSFGTLRGYKIHLARLHSGFETE